MSPIASIIVVVAAIIVVTARACERPVGINAAKQHLQGKELEVHSTVKQSRRKTADDSGDGEDSPLSPSSPYSTRVADQDVDGIVNVLREVDEDDDDDDSAGALDAPSSSPVPHTARGMWQNGKDDIGGSSGKEEPATGRDQVMHEVKAVWRSLLEFPPMSVQELQHCIYCIAPDPHAVTNASASDADTEQNALRANGTYFPSFKRQILAQFCQPLATGGGRALWLDPQLVLTLKGTTSLALRQQNSLHYVGTDSTSAGGGMRIGAIHSQQDLAPRGIRLVAAPGSHSVQQAIASALAKSLGASLIALGPTTMDDVRRKVTVSLELAGTRVGAPDVGNTDTDTVSGPGTRPRANSNKANAIPTTTSTRRTKPQNAIGGENATSAAKNLASASQAAVSELSTANLLAALFEVGAELATAGAPLVVNLQGRPRWLFDAGVLAEELERFGRVGSGTGVIYDDDFEDEEEKGDDGKDTEGEETHSTERNINIHPGVVSQPGSSVAFSSHQATSSPLSRSSSVINPRDALDVLQAEMLSPKPRAMFLMTMPMEHIGVGTAVASAREVRRTFVGQQQPQPQTHLQRQGGVPPHHPLSGFHHLLPPSFSQSVQQTENQGQGRPPPLVSGHSFRVVIKNGTATMVPVPLVPGSIEGQGGEEAMVGTRESGGAGTTAPWGMNMNIPPPELMRRMMAEQAKRLGQQGGPLGQTQGQWNNSGPVPINLSNLPLPPAVLQSPNLSPEVLQEAINDPQVRAQLDAFLTQIMDLAQQHAPPGTDLRELLNQDGGKGLEWGGEEGTGQGQGPQIELKVHMMTFPVAPGHAPPTYEQMHAQAMAQAKAQERGKTQGQGFPFPSWLGRGQPGQGASPPSTPSLKNNPISSGSVMSSTKPPRSTMNPSFALMTEQRVRDIASLFEDTNIIPPRDATLRGLWEAILDRDLERRIRRLNRRLLMSVAAEVGMELARGVLGAESGPASSAGGLRELDAMGITVLGRDDMESVLRLAGRIEAGRVGSVPGLLTSNSNSNSNMPPSLSTPATAPRHSSTLSLSLNCPPLSLWALDVALCSHLSLPVPRLGRPLARSKEEISNLAIDKHEKALAGNVVSPGDLAVSVAMRSACLVMFYALNPLLLLSHSGKLRHDRWPRRSQRGFATVHHISSQVPTSLQRRNRSRSGQGRPTVWSPWDGQDDAG